MRKPDIRLSTMLRTMEFESIVQPEIEIRLRTDGVAV
jgi:hypothetical protein